MIPKITSGSNYYGLLTYLEEKDIQHISTDNGMESILGTERIFIGNFSIDQNITLYADKNLLDSDFQEWDSMAKNRNFENKVAYFSLSFAPKDTVDKRTVIEIANEFLDRMGYKHHPVVIYQLNDKHYTHIHIVTSRVGEDGKKINNYNEAIHAIKICRELEIKYSLTQVVKGDSKVKHLDQASSQAIVASAAVPFRNAIIQNIQYFLHIEKVADIETMQKKLLLQNITMVVHDKNGNRLPNNAVRFYIKNGNKIVSYIGGSGIERNFMSNLESKLLLNNAATA